MIRNKRWIFVAALATLSWVVGSAACGGNDTTPHDVTGTGGNGASGPGPGSGPGSGAGMPASSSTQTSTGTSTSSSSAGPGGGGGGGGGPPDCVMNPMTHQEIINACTDADRIDKHPNLPLLQPDGGLPPLP